ncbi:exported hypothetical protein [Candidatus Magnetomoraceae bacterium gMMP-15]
MKKLIFIISVISLSVAFVMPSLAQDDDMEAMIREIKTCKSTDQACLDKLQKDSGRIFDSASKNFDDNFMEMSNDISVKHCRSLISEMFYHMKKLKPYYNFKRVFYLKKLEKLKENRKRIDHEEISSDDYERINRQIEEQYKNDIKESQDFIDNKVIRLQELCDTLNHTLESIQEGSRVKDSDLSEYARQSILSLQNETIWREFQSNSKEGKKIHTAIKYASNNAGNTLIQRLQGIFKGFDNSIGGAIFPAALIKRLINNYSTR